MPDSSGRRVICHKNVRLLVHAGERKLGFASHVEDLAVTAGDELNRSGSRGVRPRPKRAMPRFSCLAIAIAAGISVAGGGAALAASMTNSIRPNIGPSVAPSVTPGPTGNIRPVTINPNFPSGWNSSGSGGQGGDGGTAGNAGNGKSDKHRTTKKEGTKKDGGSSPRAGFFVPPAMPVRTHRRSIPPPIPT